MEGGDDSLEQATRNGVGLPASGVHRPRIKPVYHGNVPPVSDSIRNLLAGTHKIYNDLLAEGLLIEGLLARTLQIYLVDRLPS